jgi:23S rRNA (pseudouridine1915-N3)-methyltransferase
MKLVLLMTGKTDGKSCTDMLSDYGQRITRYLPFEVCVMPDVKNAANLPEDVQKSKEAEAMLKFFRPGDRIILLDERGREYTSAAFAASLEKQLGGGSKRIIFVIGGPYGFAKDIYDKADDMLSLSRMTFPHQLIRVIFAEQLYRALTILKGEPYHHE